MISLRKSGCTVIASAINASIAFLLGYWLGMPGMITAFLFLQLPFLVDNGPCIGMALAGLEWERTYPAWRRVVYTMLYVLSFATLFFWPILILNGIGQIAVLFFTGTTLHGWICGIRTVPR